MTVDEVEARIRQSVENYDLTITFRDDATEKLTGDDIDTLTFRQRVAEILEKQNNYDWLRGKLGKPGTIPWEKHLNMMRQNSRRR